MAPDPPHAARPPVFPVLLVNFVGTLGYSIVLPFLVFLVARFEGTSLIVAGNLVLAIGFWLLVSPRPLLPYAAAALVAIGNGVMWPAVMALVANMAGEERQGAVQGIAGGLGGLASILGLVGGGLLYESLGAATFALSAGTMLVAGAMAMALRAAHSAGRRASTNSKNGL